MLDKDITQQRVWNTKQLVSGIVSAITVTFGLTMIWGRFLFMETQTTALENKIEYVNVRLDKITGRNKTEIDINSKEIEQLKLPNTDK